MTITNLEPHSCVTVGHEVGQAGYFAWGGKGSGCYILCPVKSPAKKPAMLGSLIFQPGMIV
jgi:hypothetical protein